MRAHIVILFRLRLMLGGCQIGVVLLKSLIESIKRIFISSRPPGSDERFRVLADALLQYVGEIGVVIASEHSELDDDRGGPLLSLQFDEMIINSEGETSNMGCFRQNQLENVDETAVSSTVQTLKIRLGLTDDQFIDIATESQEDSWLDGRVIETIDEFVSWWAGTYENPLDALNERFEEDNTDLSAEPEPVP